MASPSAVLMSPLNQYMTEVRSYENRDVLQQHLGSTGCKVLLSASWAPSRCNKTLHQLNGPSCSCGKLATQVRLHSCKPLYVLGGHFLADPKASLTCSPFRLVRVDSPAQHAARGHVRGWHQDN